MKTMRAQFIYEKFVQDSDPIKDLKIGHMFVYLKPGDIIKSKKRLYLSTPNKNEFWKLLLRFEKPVTCKYNLSPGFYTLIMDVKVKKDKLYIVGIPFYNVDSCKSVWEDMMARYYKDFKQNFEWWFKTAPVETWAEYFEIVQ